MAEIGGGGFRRGLDAEAEEKWPEEEEAGLEKAGES